MHTQFIIEKKKHTIIWDFEKQTDHLTPARQPDLDIVNKKREPTE